MATVHSWQLLINHQSIYDNYNSECHIALYIGSEPERDWIAYISWLMLSGSKQHACIGMTAATGASGTYVQSATAKRHLGTAAWLADSGRLRMLHCTQIYMYINTWQSITWLWNQGRTNKGQYLRYIYIHTYIHDITYIHYFVRQLRLHALLCFFVPLKICHSDDTAYYIPCGNECTCTFHIITTLNFFVSCWVSTDVSMLWTYLHTST